MNEKLDKILKDHVKWLYNKKDGKRASLVSADLRNADLRNANLRGADLRNADLSCANLRGADLRNADLRGADLSYADLSCANLRGADLRNANLRGADLSYADLSYADLRNADLRGTVVFFQTPPSHGSFTGWKKAQNNLIVKLLIPENAKRSSAAGRKCRCDKAEVLEIQDIYGNIVNTTARSMYSPSFIYEVGKTVSVNNFDTNRFNECAPGIHFYVTREEAVGH